MMTEQCKRLRHVELELDGDPWRIPYWDVDSGKPGPCLLVCAAIHGTEINGSPAIVRWAGELPETLLRGRVLAVPFASLPAVRVGQQAEREDLGKLQVWPGAFDGNRKEQVYHALYRELVVQATHAIDLHSYGETQAAEALTREDSPAGMDLGLAAALPFTRIIAVPPGGRETFPPPAGGKAAPCTLERLMTQSGRTGITLELCGQSRIFPREGQRALDSLRRMAAHLGLVAKPDTPPPETIRIHSPRDDGCGVLLTAPGYGLFLAADKRPGDDVLEGETFVEWIAEDTLAITTLRAPVSGRIRQLGVRYPKPKAGSTAASPAAGPQRSPAPPQHYPYAAPGAILAEIFPAG